MHRSFVVCLALCVVPAPGRAAEPTFEQALGHYRSMEYAEAVTVARQVLARGRSGPDELRKIYELLGQASAIVGQGLEAKSYFRQLLALQPDYRLPEQVSPKIRAPLAEVQSDWAGRPGLTMAHTAAATALVSRQLDLVVRVTEDPLRMARSARVVYQLEGSVSPSQVEAPAAKGDLHLTIDLPALGARPGKLHYRVELLDQHGNVLVRKPETVVDLITAEKSSSGSTPWYKRWWVWTVAGAVVGGVTVAAVLSTRSSSTSNLEVGWSVKGLRW